MKFKSILTALMLTVVLAMAGLALAATSNPSPASPGYTPLVLPISGLYSSARPGLVKFKAPNGYKIQAANVNARAVAGTNPTMKVLVKSGAYTNYSGTLTAAGTPKDLTAGTTTLIADESTVAVDLVMGGTSPQFRDLTLFILLKRR